MNLNKSQLSLLITLFSMSIVILLLFNIHLGSIQEDEYVIEMSLADEDIEKLLEEEEERLEEMKADNNPIKSHMAVNQTAKPSVGNPEPLKTLEELIEERALNSETGEYADNSAFEEQLKQLRAQRDEKKEKLGERDAHKEEFTDYLKDRQTSISYSLLERNAYYLPPPIYTCIEGGKVVVNIAVDNNGYVTEASFNDKSSGTSNGCLVDNAIAYALKARFSPDSKNSQIGTITYLFQSK
ncbi:energy transducer TonB [Allomuricauda sp. F6463D]|uniref:energy transducer TonB family protein n=1 Tax=Allomuricauda sp. F6463D TaxID=2926409 RepID=UPI001FF30F8B|nr:energy transducer TonB [Muricauda sp. F6463D]MCK0161477.1 energy transducer TonB [Muricauda sp. F6463D]